MLLLYCVLSSRSWPSRNLWLGRRPRSGPVWHIHIHTHRQTNVVLYYIWPSTVHNMKIESGKGTAFRTTHIKSMHDAPAIRDPRNDDDGADGKFVGIGFVIPFAKLPFRVVPKTPNRPFCGHPYGCMAALRDTRCPQPDTLPQKTEKEKKKKRFGWMQRDEWFQIESTMRPSGCGRVPGRSLHFARITNENCFVIFACEMGMRCWNKKGTIGWIDWR